MCVYSTRPNTHVVLSLSLSLSLRDEWTNGFDRWLNDADHREQQTLRCHWNLIHASLTERGERGERESESDNVTFFLIVVLCTQWVAITEKGPVMNFNLTT